MAGVTVLRGAVAGSGYGDGSGYGSGYGYGYGDGAGYGYGDGSGYGYGSGYGSGYGDGDGDGAGYGYGDGPYWRAVMPYTLKHWTEQQVARFWQLIDQNVPLAFWRSNEHGQPSNGGNRITAAAPQVIHKTKGPLNLCSAGTLHATLIPPKWQGSRIWIVALHGDVVGNEEKFGCLKREIVGEFLLR